MQIQFDGKPVASGDQGSVTVIFNNLAGAGLKDLARWPGYVDMMNEEFFRESPLKQGVRVDLVCHGLVYGSFVYGGEMISGVGNEDIARIYQKNRPHRVFEQQIQRSIYEDVCRWCEDGLKLVNNPFDPVHDFEKYEAFAYGRYRVVSAADYLELSQRFSKATSTPVLNRYQELLNACPWYGDERTGLRLQDAFFLEPSPF